MTDFPDTRDSLLVQAKDPRNAEAWEQFARIYRPVIYRLARNRGMQDADAQDLAQQVFFAGILIVLELNKGSQEPLTPTGQQPPKE